MKQINEKEAFEMISKYSSVNVYYNFINEDINKIIEGIKFNNKKIKGQYKAIKIGDFYIKFSDGGYTTFDPDSDITYYIEDNYLIIKETRKSKNDAYIRVYYLDK